MPKLVRLSSNYEYVCATGRNVASTVTAVEVLKNFLCPVYYCRCHLNT